MPDAFSHKTRSHNMRLRSFFAVALLACLMLVAGVGQGQARELVDMVGRRVSLPDHIERIYAASPPSNLLVMALAPDRLIGLALPLKEGDKKFLPPVVASLPVVGAGMGMGPQVNLESLMALHPQVVVAWAEAGADLSRQIEPFDHMGLPVIFLTLDHLADYPAALRLLGTLLGEEKRAEELAAYGDGAMARVSAALAAVPAAERTSVYYAESPDGLASDCDQSFHTEAIVLAGGANVYRCTAHDHMGMERLGLDQVIGLHPTWIIAQDAGFARVAAHDPRWQILAAVQNHQLVTVPRTPFNWLDRPPSYMRFLGIQWLAHLFYPQAFPWDQTAEVQHFYRLFFGVELSEQDVRGLFP